LRDDEKTGNRTAHHLLDSVFSDERTFCGFCFKIKFSTIQPHHHMVNTTSNYFCNVANTHFLFELFLDMSQNYSKKKMETVHIRAYNLTVIISCNTIWY